MKITCQACQAKYTIADEKVVGKVVKIRCKKCGASIVVNGNHPSAGASQRPALEGAIENVGPVNAHASWTVNVADGDQRTMTEAEIVASYAADIVTEETFCWQEGMADWLPVREIAALHAACTAKAGTSAQDDKEEEGLETKIQDPTAAPPATRSAAAPPARPSNRPSTKEGNGSLAALAPAAAMAARRAAGRTAAADLFSSAARAGGEEDVLTSAPAGVPPMHDDGKLTGARNENSLLFGLQEKGGAPLAPSMTATNEASGLIDIRQLSAQMRSTDEKKQSRVDDIMNLGGGGQFSPSLGAPILTAPSLEAYSQPPPPNAVGAVGIAGDTQARNKAMIFLALGGGTFFLVAAIGVAVLLLRGKAWSSDDHDKSRTSTTEATPTGGASVAMNPPTGGVASAPRSAASPEVSGGSPSQGASAGAKEAPTKDTKETAAPAAPKETAPKEPKPGAATTPKETAPAGAQAAEFNMGEARSRLAGIAGGVQSCKRGETTGGGKVEIVFAPSGAVQSANLMSGSPFDGTPTGKCVEARFRGAHVPAFGGSPFTVTKSFSIN